MPFKDPEQKRAYMRTYMRQVYQAARKNGAGTPAQHQTPEYAEFRLRKAQTVWDILWEQIKAVKGDKSSSPIQKARAIGYLCGIALRVIEVWDLEERLSVLEERLNESTRAIENS